MGTQQELTTKQLETLIIFDELQKLAEADLICTGIKEILTQDHFMSLEEFNEVFEALNYYGYVDMYGNVTMDGKQYVALFLDYLEKKEKNPDIAINNSFTLISLENLNFGVNTFLNLDAVVDAGKMVSSIIGKVQQYLKNIMQ